MKIEVGTEVTYTGDFRWMCNADVLAISGDKVIIRFWKDDLVYATRISNIKPLWDENDPVDMAYRVLR